MGLQIIFAQAALQDLEDIHLYIAADNPDAAHKFRHRLVDRAAILVNFPGLGSKLKESPGLRSLVESPYLIIYRHHPDSDTIEIVRFWHGARDRSELDL